MGNKSTHKVLLIGKEQTRYYYHIVISGIDNAIKLYDCMTVCYKSTYVPWASEHSDEDRVRLIVMDGES